MFQKRTGTLAGWYQQGCSVIAAVVSVPIVLRHLGGELTGIWLGFQSIAAVAALADFGFAYVTSRQTAFELGRASVSTQKDAGPDQLAWEGVSRTWSAARLLNYISIGISAVVLAGIGYFLPHNHRFDAIPAISLIQVWVLLGATILVTLFSKPAFAVLEGSGNLPFTRIVSGTQLVATSLGGAVAAALGGGLPIMALVALLLALAACGSLTLALRRLTRLHEMPRRPVTRHELKAMALTALPIGAVNVGAYCFSAVQVPLIAGTLSPSLVAPYYLMQRLGQFSNMAVLQFMFPELPKFSQLYAANLYGKAAELMRSTILHVTLLTFLAMAIFATAGSWIIRSFFHVEPPPFSVVALMAVDYLLLNCTVCWGQFVLSSGRNPFFIPTLLAGAANVTLLTFLSPRLSLVAMPLSSLLAGTAFTYWFNAYTGFKLYKQLTKAQG